MKMFMKRLKYALISIGVLLLLFRLLIFIIRLPSYTIQTSGKLYIVSKLSRDTQVFNLFTGKEIAEIPIDIIAHEAAITIDKNSVVFTNYGGSDGNIIKVVNTKANEVEKSIELKGNIRLNGIIALPEANKVAVIDYVNNNLLVLNIETDSIEKQIHTKQKSSHLLVLHPNKPIAYVTNVSSGSISVVDLNLKEIIKIIPCGLGRKGIDITPDGSEIWVTNTKLNSITIINTSTYQIIDMLRTGDEPLKLKFSIDGKYCLVANAIEGTIYVYNQQSRKKIKTIFLRGRTTILERILYHTPRPVNILIHPNGLYAFVANSNSNKIEVIDMKTFAIVSTIGTGKVPDGLIFIE
jgi:YVTN family beta-propeller protein